MIKVLYVDDEADTQTMASKFDLMRHRGIDVIKVTRVAEVLKEIEKHQSEIKLLVLDIIMPPEDKYSLEETNRGTDTGIRVLQDIRERYKTLPILIVSIRRTQGLEKIGEEYGVADILEKPVSAHQVANTIKRIVAGSNS
jgi:CheY-like chemotaxis protein